MTTHRHSEGQLPVGPLLPPPGTYTFTAATPPIRAPDGEPLAQLAQIPDWLGSFIGIAFPPFGRPPLREPAHPLPPEEQIAYRIVGLVQYRGEEREIVIETIRPSPAGLRRELVLGNPAGELEDGTALLAMWSNHLRLRRGDTIVDLYSEAGRDWRESPGEWLKALAENVVLI